MSYSLTITEKCNGQHVSFQHSHYHHFDNYFISERYGNPTPVNAPACSGKYCLAKIMPEGADRNNTWRCYAISAWERKEGNNGVQGPLGCRTDMISRLAWPHVRYWALRTLYGWCECELNTPRCLTCTQYTWPRGHWFYCLLETDCHTSHSTERHCLTGKLAQTNMLLPFIRKVPG
jgi:hypothetical protein